VTPDGTRQLPPPASGGGAWLAHLCVAATTAFALVALAALFVTSLRGMYVWICLVLFAAGMAFFLAAIVLAGARSYREGVGVRSSGLFLAGFAPKQLALRFRVSMGVTVLAALVAAVANRDPSPLVIDIPAMAYGILVPILPFALAGFHGARYCPWPAREGSAAK